MIVVTGATGALNGATVDHLLERVPADQITVVVRDRAKAERFADSGVAVRAGDYADPSGLPAAFEGADQLLLVSSNDPGTDAVSLHRSAIEAAVAVGVGRILYTSHQGAAADSPFAPAKVHAATEGLLADSGVAWTSLRNGFYLHSIDWLAGPWRETGTIRVPADGPVSWTSREDAAEAAALIITAPSPLDGPVTITAPEAVCFEQIAEIASEVTGRSIAFEMLDPQEWVAAQVAAGSPEGMARFTLGMFQAASGGWFAGVDPLLQKMIGREPRTVHAHIAGAAL
ncbi:MAG: SDR family oxidoreductase [Nakamurella sp.]